MPLLPPLRMPPPELPPTTLVTVPELPPVTPPPPDELPLAPPTVPEDAGTDEPLLDALISHAGLPPPASGAGLNWVVHPITPTKQPIPIFRRGENTEADSTLLRRSSKATS
jgi:hypothetical protein